MTDYSAADDTEQMPAAEFRLPPFVVTSGRCSMSNRVMRLITFAQHADEHSCCLNNKGKPHGIRHESITGSTRIDRGTISAAFLMRVVIGVPARNFGVSIARWTQRTSGSRCLTRPTHWTTVLSNSRGIMTLLFD